MTDNNIEIKERRMKFAGHDVTDLADRYGTPLYLMDEARIRENCRRYTDCLDIMPREFMMLWKNNVTKKLQTKENRKSAAVTEVNVSEHTTFLKAELPTTELILHYINLNKYLTVILMKLLMHLLRLTKPQNLQVRMIKEI